MKKHILLAHCLWIGMLAIGCRKVDDLPEPYDLPTVPGWTFEAIPMKGFAEFYPLSMHFSSARNGYATGKIGELYAVLHTIDAGKTWAAIDAPNLGQVASNVVAVDDAVAYLAEEDGRLLRTLDGGMHWLPTAADSLGFLKSMHFIDRNHGLANEWSVSPLTGLVSFAVERTTDGGDHWAPITAGIQANDATEIAYAEGVYYVSGQDGNLIKSQDWGANWQTVTLPLQSSDEIYQVRFGDANDGFLQISGGHVIHTVDGGNTWAAATLPFSNIEESHFFSRSEGFHFGPWWPSELGNMNEFPSGTLIHHTTDGGNSWETPASARGMFLRRYAFPDSNTGCLMGKGMFYRMTRN